MGSFGGLILTSKGLALQAKAQTGTQLNFTRMAAGDGVLGAAPISGLNALISQKMSLTITSFKAFADGRSFLRTVLSNQGLATGFYFREIGVFAQDPDVGEILYCYANAGASVELIPPAGGPEAVEKIIDVFTVVGNAQNVSATIESTTYVTVVDFNGLAGAGRTAETVKGVSDAVATHLADYVRQPGYGTTAGVANAYTLALNPALAAYTAGVCVAVQINAANTGASTINVNGLGAKSIRDSKGIALTAGKLILNGVYTMRYDGVNFILQGEGGFGNATASDLLSGKTASVDAGDIIGTMPNRGAQILTPGIANVAITAGYHNGAGYVQGDADLIPGNIRNGVDLFGVAGTYGIPTTPQGMIAFRSSGHFVVPPGVTQVDVFIVGGGGGGTGNLVSGAGYGGGGGYTKTYKAELTGHRNGAAIPVTPGELIPITVGAGGAGATGAVNASNGGFSQFKDANYRADGGFGATTTSGGNGGSGGGDGILDGGRNGANSHGTGQGYTTFEFGAPTSPFGVSPRIYAGGGGGYTGGYSNGIGGRSGSPNSGDGHHLYNGFNGADGTGDGGGGSGAATGGIGGSGVVIVRWGY